MQKIQDYTKYQILLNSKPLILIKLHAISSNFEVNKYFPFISKTFDLTKSNFDNIDSPEY